MSNMTVPVQKAIQMYQDFYRRHPKGVLSKEDAADWVLEAYGIMAALNRYRKLEGGVGDKVRQAYGHLYGLLLHAYTHFRPVQFEYGRLRVDYFTDAGVAVIMMDGWPVKRTPKRPDLRWTEDQIRRWVEKYAAERGIGLYNQQKHLQKKEVI